MAKILVVDDKKFARVKLMSVFDKSQHQIIDADSGKEAVRLYIETRPDIVFCDLIMPEMDGVSTLRLIKEFDDDAVVVIVTSLGIQAVLMEALASGAKEVIMKPFDKEKVLDLFNRLVT